jgi:hypothetical protein
MGTTLLALEDLNIGVTGRLSWLGLSHGLDLIV